MIYRVSLSPAAVGDVAAIRRWIAAQADDDVAIRYTDRIGAKFETLAEFPTRGTPRPGYGPGCRSITFERRYIIVYRVIDDEVWVERVADGYHDWDWLN